MDPRVRIRTLTEQLKNLTEHQQRFENLSKKEIKKLKAFGSSLGLNCEEIGETTLIFSKKRTVVSGQTSIYPSSLSMKKIDDYLRYQSSPSAQFSAMSNTVHQNSLMTTRPSIPKIPNIRAQSLSLPLPIHEYREEILNSIEANQVIIISSETG